MLNLCINQTADVDDLYLYTSLHQNVPHGFDLNLSVIAVRVAARVGVKESPFWAPCAKTYPRVQLQQLFSLLLRIPILALLEPGPESLITLNPSLLQCFCNDALRPINDFHVSRPLDVFRYFPSAISECRELARMWTTNDLISAPSFITRQILENGVLQ